MHLNFTHYKLRLTVVSSALVLLILTCLTFQSNVSRARNSFPQSPPENSGKSKRRQLAESAPGEILVRFRTDAIEASSTLKGGTGAQFATEAQGRTLEMNVERLDRGPEMIEGLRIVRVTPEQTAAAIEALRARPDVIYAEPNYIRHAARLPDDPRFSEMWGLKNIGQATDSGGHAGMAGNDIRAEQAWDLTTGSKDVVVGIIDEGIDVNHEDLRDNIWSNPTEIPANGIDDDGNGFVDDVNGWDFAHNDNTVFDYTEPSYPASESYSGDIDDHGTHVAGILGAKGNNGLGVAGVNWQVSLMSLKFLTSQGGTSADLLKAFSYAKMMRQLWTSSGGTKGANIRVLNNSYGGGGFSQAELDAIRGLGDAGILFVVAAGNEGLNNDAFPTYPANYISTNLISVAASTGVGPRASFSNYGPATVNVTAPGDHILSTTPRNTYNFFSGTSMATPFVAGSAALLCAAYPNISVQKLRSVLLYSGFPAPWLYQSTYPVSTGRSVDANASLLAVTSSDTTPPGDIAHLAANNTFPNFGLNWGAPGDDGNAGKAAAYESRFSDSDLSNSAQFDLATPLPGPVPDLTGTTASQGVRVPWRHASGYLGVRAIDDVGNAGPISTIPVSTDIGVADPYVMTEEAPSALSTGGTALGLVGDDQNKAYTLPFNFHFFDGDWSTVSVSSNGAIYLGPAPANGDAESSVRLLSGYRMIAGSWDDLRTDRRAGDDVYVVQPDLNRVIFRWSAVTYDTPISPTTTRGENPVNFEIELQSSGTIILRYGSGNEKLLPVVGLGGAWPEPYLSTSHSSDSVLINLTSASTVKFTLRNPPNPPASDLSLTMTSGPNPVGSGGQETYNLRVGNDGPYDAPNTIVTDQLPAGLVFVACTTSGGTCTGPAAGTNGAISINLGQLNRFVTQNIQIIAQVTATSGSVSNTASVTSSRFDSNTANNSATTTVDVAPIGAFNDVIAISSSYATNFAVKRDGTIWGWGRNDYGVMILGDGNTGLGQSSTPVRTQLITNAVAVSTGGTHSLVLASNGTVWGWGSNGSGESGGAPPYPHLPSTISGLNNIIAVSAGFSHSLALQNDGTVWAWGANDSGQLGLGNNNFNPAPTKIPGLTGVTFICAGTNLSLVVKNDGTVWSWGANPNGQLGHSGGPVNTPTQVSGVTGVKSLAVSFNHVLALKTDGTVMGWGMNAFGQTGSSNLTNINPTPSLVNGVTNAKQVAAGQGFSLALRTDETIVAWGLSSQLGTGSNSGTAQLTPVVVNGITNAMSIAAGSDHSLVLLSDGSLRAWGDNSYGQLGDGTTFRRITPVVVSGVAVVSDPLLDSSGVYTSPSPILVRISTLTADAVLHYTLNGQDPTESSPTIASGSSLTISQSSILRVRAYKTGWLPSNISVAVYTIQASANQIDIPRTFVQQHYVDFLSRQPDQSGWDFWTNQITACGGDVGCLEVHRINVSASFFLSIEFQQTGYLVERLYKAAYGDATGSSTFNGAHQLKVPMVRFDEFQTDTQLISQGVIVNQGNWQQQLENNKQTFIADFVQRPRFTKEFPGSMSAAQFVDTLDVNAGLPLSQAERDSLVNDLSANKKTRAEVLRAIAEDPDLGNAEYNRAFVLMQYFGYLRRNPNDPQDTDYSGYDFWLTKLNQFNGNYINAEMVKAFLSSIEYRQRF